MENVCSNCGKCFKYKRNLVVHEKYHSEMLPFNCCGLGFPSSRSLQRHRCTVHGDTKLFICKECGKAFATQSDLRSHETREENPSALFCDTCGYRTALRRDLAQHMISHSSEWTNVCRTCGARYKHQSALYRHKRNKHKQS